MNLTFLKNFQDIYNCGHNFRERFENLSAKYYICQHGITEELRYGIIEFDKNDKSYIIIDKHRTLVYDSKISSIDI